MSTIFKVALLLLLVAVIVYGFESECNESDEDIGCNNPKILIKRKIDDAQWNQWSTWSACSKTCGGGIQTRTRTCQATAGQSCTGLAKEEKPCNQKACPGVWSQWSQWTNCLNKEQSRTRTCTGGTCSGPTKETRPCRQSSWSDWRPWSSCSVTCGNNGQQTRTRTCQGGTDCPNPNTNTEKRPCSPQPPQCMKWNEWSKWTECSKKCAGGEQSRNRTCVVDGPTNINQTTKALSCVGPNRETQKCNTAVCPKDAKWSDWSVWSACSITCGTNGKQTRKRTCVGGTTCVGPNEETRPCPNLKPCQDRDGRWGEWSKWTVCSKSCAGGEQTRQRKCVDGNDCAGSTTEKRPCNTQACPTWGDWNWSGPCTVTCGNGVRRRTRNCVGGPGCIGASDEFVACTNAACKD